MKALWHSRNGRTVGATLLGMALVALAFLSLARPQAGVAETASTPPAEQEYIGTKKCAACHFPQFRTWKNDPHSKTLENLPAKYREDPECLKCHSTGFGTPTGYKDASMTELASTSCEACHGPGSEHAKIALKFVEEDITPEGEKMVRESTHKIPLATVCIDCHQQKGHKEHPDFDKE